MSNAPRRTPTGPDVARTPGESGREPVGLAASGQTLPGSSLPSDPGRVMRLLVEGMREYAIFVLDIEGRISSWNPGAERFKGYTAEEIIGRHF
jgi:PAS domain-containing protein